MARELHDALELDTRRMIYHYIKAHPGAHLRGVHRAVGLPFGQVLYHLNYMEKNELIVVKKDGKFNRYFVKHLLGRKEKDVISVLRHDIPRKLCILLLFHERMTHKDMLQYVDVSPSTLSFHLNKMSDLGVIMRESVGRESHYSLTDVELTAKTLILHRESFHSDLVDRFADAWLTLRLADPRSSSVDGVTLEPSAPPDLRKIASSVLGAIPAPAAQAAASGASPAEPAA